MWSDDVTYFAHIHEPSTAEAEELRARDIRVVHGEIRRLVIDEDQLTGVLLETGEIVKRRAIFVRPVITPRPGYLLAALGCDLDESGFAVVDRSGRTSVRGVWGAGNAVDPRAQVITAAGAGSAAAIDINNNLVQDDIALATASTGSLTGARGDLTEPERTSVRR